MPSKKVIVIGGSAGALPVLQEIVHHLPDNLAAPILVTLHISPESPSVLPKILNRAGGPRATFARDQAKLQSPAIYVAPPDRHLVVADGRMRLTQGPRENRSRPAIDPMFRSAANAYGPGVIAVLLSGLLDDGVAGLRSVSAAGGRVIVLKPQEADFPQMPQNAIRSDHPDYVLAPREISHTIQELISHPRNERKMSKKANGERKKTPSGYICPECGGSMFETGNRNFPQFECRVGHAFSMQALVSAENDMLETALWAAVRALEENAALKERAAKNLGKHGAASGKRLREDARIQRDQAHLIRDRVLHDGQPR